MEHRLPNSYRASRNPVSRETESKAFEYVLLGSDGYPTPQQLSRRLPSLNQPEFGQLIVVRLSHVAGEIVTV